jgi:FtsP/CotA-like multicopper oxidase with cupredoxin domain
MLNRRGFLLSSAAMIAAGAATRLVRPASADDALATLRAESRTIEVHGKPATVFGIRQPNGTHGLTTDMATRFRLRLENGCGEPTLIHWHGLKPPYRQDGVPDLSAPLVAPGDAADYDFPLAFPGTFWMHSHQGLQQQRLMAAPLIVRDGTRLEGQEIVMMLHDFAFASPEEILAGLRKGMAGGAMPMGAGSAGSAMPGMAMPGMGHDMAMKHGGMAMDLNDVAYDAFLANDRTLADPEIVRVEPGGPILLRIINGAAASNFVIDLGRLEGALVAVDGHPIQPVAGSRFPIAMAQRLDLRLRLPKERAAHPVLALLEGEKKRTGIVLAPAGARIARLGESAEKPVKPLDFAFERGLKAAAPLSLKPADRVHRLDLTGAMSPYEWGLNGAAYPDALPLTVARGERVEIAMTNRTMMSHPMHLHGHVFQVVALGGTRFPGAVRDTVLVPPMTTVTIAFDADNPGQWLFHCHNLYHMATGMMAELRYEGV